MTDAEIWELILLSQANAATYFAMFLTLLSGYLVTAYMVGAKLTRQQIYIINSLFIIAAATMAFPTYASFSRAAFLLDFTGEAYRSPDSSRMAIAPLLLASLSTGAVAACLKFMWDIRHTGMD